MKVRILSDVTIEGRACKPGDTAEVSLAAAKLLAESGHVRADGELAKRLVDEPSRADLDRAEARRMHAQPETRWERR